MHCTRNGGVGSQVLVSTIIKFVASLIYTHKHLRAATHLTCKVVVYNVPWRLFTGE